MVPLLFELFEVPPSFLSNPSAVLVRASEVVKFWSYVWLSKFLLSLILSLIKLSTKPSLSKFSRT